MDISVIVVNMNTKGLLLECLASVYATIKRHRFEVWVVDNGSKDGSPEAVKQAYPDVNLIQNHTNLGFGAANNQAFRQMNGRYALLLNTDSRLIDGAAAELLRFMENQPDVGAACGQLLFLDGSKQYSFDAFPTFLSLFLNTSLLRVIFPGKYPNRKKDISAPIEVDSCLGACMMVRREAMSEVDFFDEDYFFFFEETDLAYRLNQAGWKAFFIPNAHAYHLQGETVGEGLNPRILFYRSRRTFFKKTHPYTFLLYESAVFIRLLMNLSFTSIGMLFTMGLHPDLKERFFILLRLMAWNLGLDLKKT